MARYLELRRHTANDGDVLTGEGVRAALELGARLAGPYDLLVSSGAQRATQALACVLAGWGRPVPGGVVVEPGLRSTAEDRWRELARQAGTSELGALLAADQAFVEQEAATLAAGLRRVLAALPADGRALAVGHSPTNEAAVYGLAGVIVPPLGKGAGVLLVADGDAVRVEPLDPGG